MADKMIVGVQFNPVGKVYAFSLSENEVVQAGDIVLVSTARGRQLGRVVKTNARNRLEQKKSSQSSELPMKMTS